MYSTKKLSQILAKDDFVIGKIKTRDYLSDGNFVIVDQGKDLIGGYSNEKDLVYTGKLPVLIYGDHTNVVKYIDFPFIGGADGIKIFSFQKDVDTRYAFYLLEHFKPETQGYRRHYSLLKDINLPLPSLSTQIAIVAQLDAAFANIDTQISLLRANIADVENVRKSVLEESFQDREYEKKKLGEICDFFGSGFACNKKNEVPNGYVHLRTHNVGIDGKLNFDQFITINPDMVDVSRSKIYKGDIIFNNTNSKELVGKTAYVDQDYEYGFSNHLTRLVIKKTIYSKYISLYINYLFGKGFFQNLANKWIGQAGINNTMLKALEIPLPHLPRQHEIVAHLDQVFAETAKLKTQYEAQIQDLNTLKQSLLEEAFSGRLVPEEK